jgi:hypothetical protein
MNDKAVRKIGTEASKGNEESSTSLPSVFIGQKCEGFDWAAIGKLFDLHSILSNKNKNTHIQGLTPFTI